MTNVCVTIHLVDDDERILTALRRLLTGAGYRVQEYQDAEEFLANHDPDVPGCAIVDLGLPGMDGLAVQQALTASDSECPIIFLTGCGDIPTSVRAIKAGAIDFLTKPVDAATLLAAIATAVEKDAASREACLQRRLVEERLASLTPREREVFGCVVAGRLNKQIAADLGTVEKTIKVHRGRMMEKMRVRTVADLVRLSTMTVR